MGVPKFYRWISERYPCLSEVVKENQIPEFDNLYLDMNGIIHPCSHPNDEDVHFRITEAQIFEAIFHYIEVLFRIIKPRKVFFMAVDGVAPRAKMNQQRGRRFRSAKEAEAREKEAQAKGEVLPTEKRFDSNCITPGTTFMVRLHEQLKYFVRQKMTKDPTWQGLKVYLSGHETPGEGEHKIMDFIRSERARKDYDPNTRHCLYGLDADLIMLGLISHDPHFSLLREEVRFGKIANQKRPTTPEETTFHLLHLSLMREYLEIEFSAVKPFIDWFDLERIIDDWVLMGYLVGNDFIPHLPDMHISHNALPLMYKAYIEILPSLGGYLNEHGTLNLPRFEKYLVHLSKFDKEKFEETFVDMSFFAGKTDIRAWKSSRVEAKKEMDKQRRVAKANSNQFAVLENLQEVMGSKPTPGMREGSKVNDQAFDLSQDSGDEDEEDGDTFEDEFKAHKRAYYADKFEIENITEGQLSEIVYNYILAIQWILDYYYNGIQSWGWYYPYHYAPFLSDLRSFSNFNLKYEKGMPFLPFQQLLGVLPAASKDLLPEPYQKLMTMDNSPIIDYYPVDFATDLNGKLQQWEAVVLIPFIDENRLLAAMDSVSKYVTAAEKKHNRHGPHLLHTYDETLNYKYPSSLPGHFPDINACRARCEELDKDEFHLEPSKLQCGLLPGAKTGVYFPGFPTLHHLKFSTKFGKDDIKVFQQNSRGESVILTIQTENADVEAKDVANELLGKACFAEWPHLKEVKVVAVADDATRYEFVENKLKSPQEKPVIKKHDMTDLDAASWVKDIQAIQERYHKRKGVKIGPTYVIVYACPLMGRRYVSGHSGVVTLEKQWSLTPVTYAYQVMVKDIAVHDSSFKQFKTLEEAYPKQSNCFMLGSPNYGCQGSVVDVEDGRVRVLFSLPVEPNLNPIKSSQSYHEVQYLPAHILAQRLGLTSLIISRLSGSILVGRGSKASSSVGPSGTFNVGLNLKFNKSNQEVQGYSKKDETGTWLYSSKVTDIIRDYIAKFPEVFRHISQHPRADTFFEDDLFEGKAGRMKELQDFIKDLPSAKATKVNSSLKNLDEPVIKLMEAEVKKVSGLRMKKQKMCVRPHLLYQPHRHLGNLIPDPEAEHELFDRIINVREGYTVPLGLRGVIIGIQPGESVLDHVYEVVFDEEFPGGLVIRCTGTRGYRLPTTAFINISYGMRKEQGQQQSNKPMAVVKPQVFPQPSPQTQSRGWYSNMVGKLGAPQHQQQQQQQQQRKPQVQAQSKSTAAVNYRAALSQDNTPKQEREHKASSQPAPAMTILTRSGPKPITRTPTKEPQQGKGSSPRETTPRRQSKEEMKGRRNTAEVKTQSRTAEEQKKRIDSGTKQVSSLTIVATSDKPNLKSNSKEMQGKEVDKPQVIKQDEQLDNEADEFANMWRKLQRGANSGTSSPITENSSPDKEEDGSDDLSSPFASGGQTPLSEEDVGQPSIQMQLAMSALPKVEAQMSKVTEGETTVEEGDEECEGEEFEVDEESRMTPRTYVKSGTEELCRMLKISSVSDDLSAPKDVSLPHSVVIEASSGKKQYGIPLSLDQLFAAGAGNKEPSPPASPVPVTPTNQASKPMVPQGVRQPTAQHPYPPAGQPGPIPLQQHPGIVRGPAPFPTAGQPVIISPNINPAQPNYPSGAFHQSPVPHSSGSVAAPTAGSAAQVSGQAGVPIKAASPGVVMLRSLPAQQLIPAPVPQGAMSPGRASGNYSPQSVGPPSQQAPPVILHGAPVYIMGPGHQQIAQQPPRLQQQQFIVAPQQQQQQQLGMQHQVQQSVGPPSSGQQPQTDAGGVQLSTGEIVPPPTSHLLQHQQHQQQQATVSAAVTASAQQHQPSQQPTGVVQGSAFKSGPLQPAPQAQRGPQQMPPMSTSFGNAPNLSASPMRPHPGPQASGTPSQPLTVRPRPLFPGQQHRPPFPQGFQRPPQNAVQALVVWCQHNGLPPPVYQFQSNLATHQIRGIAQLANGHQFFGRDCHSETAAVEAAAQVAMANLTSQQARAPLMQQQLRPTTRPGAVGPPHGVMIHTSGPNPFVPLQVTKQLNSPARSTSTEMEATSPGKAMPEPAMQYPTATVPSKDTPPCDGVDLATTTDQSGTTGRSKLASQSEPNSGSGTVQPEAPVTEMEQSSESHNPSQDGTPETVLSERRASSDAANRKRRNSSKAKLAINFGAKGKND